MAREWSCSRRLTIYGEERGWWLQKITDGHVLGTDLSAVWTEKHERFLACVIHARWMHRKDDIFLS
jgi:hypothetical protein